MKHSLKNLGSLFALCLAASALVVPACVVEETANDDDGETSTGSGGAGGAPVAGPLGSPELSQAELTRHVTYLASDELEGRDEGTPGGALARAYIIAEMQRCGIQPAVNGGYEQPITAGDAFNAERGTNIIGIVPGTDPNLAARHVMISAHYDHQGRLSDGIHNGAEDNAAGVAIVLGLGCALAAEPQKRSIVVVSWDAEEPPTYMTPAMGSMFYAANPVIPLEQTDASLVLDLVGGAIWPGFRNTNLLGSELSPQVRAAVDTAPAPEGLLGLTMGLHLAEERPDGHIAWSDYDAFRNAGIPVLFMTNGQTPRYHQATDDIESLDLEKLAMEAQWLGQVTLNLANADETPTFNVQGADYLRDAQSIRALLEHAVAPGGMIDSLGMTAESRTNMESDLANVIRIGDGMSNGGAATTEDVAQLRNAVQRLLCYASPDYQENVCNFYF